MPVRIGIILVIGAAPIFVARTPIIDIKGLSLADERDGRRTIVLSELDLAVARGQFVVIVGRSGVGKSTLLRALICLADLGQRRP